MSVDAECLTCPTVSLCVPADVERLTDDLGRLLFAVAPGTLVIGGGDSRTHVMLHIMEGVVKELQLYRDDGDPVGDRPDLAEMVLEDVS
ncbi:MAG: hypothetical protein M3451_01595 [Chloroflexota bacterium]|nr:hypothetical protein [Chloroflexota bacterium]